jgi:glyoxylase-like metal-dependent hydrolase (beta-lactamase superfamily II)
MTKQQLVGVVAGAVAVLAIQPQVAGKGHLSLLGPQVARGTGASQDTLRIVLLGTGIGPPVTLDQYGPSTLVEAGDARLLFDFGRGVSLRLAQVGVPIQSVSRLFLTHLHSDHVLQIPDLLLAGWSREPSIQRWKLSFAVDLPPNLKTGRWREGGAGRI